MKYFYNKGVSKEQSEIIWRQKKKKKMLTYSLSPYSELKLFVVQS